MNMKLNSLFYIDNKLVKYHPTIRIIILSG